MNVQKSVETYKVACIDGHFYPCTEFEITSTGNLTQSSSVPVAGITTHDFEMTLLPGDIQPVRGTELDVILTYEKKRIRLASAYIDKRTFDETELHLTGEANDVSYRNL